MYLEVFAIAAEIAVLEPWCSPRCSPTPFSLTSSRIAMQIRFPESAGMSDFILSLQFVYKLITDCYCDYY